MDRNEIILSVKNAITRGNRLFSMNLAEPKIEFHNKGSAAGIVYPHKNVVSFNEEIAKRHPTEFQKTISHEVAHLFQKTKYPFSRDHGKEFKYFATVLGGSPAAETYHSYDVTGLVNRKTKVRYEAKCKCSEAHSVTQSTYKNLNSGVVFRCKECGNPIQLTGIVYKFK